MNLARWTVLGLAALLAHSPQASATANPEPLETPLQGPVAEVREIRYVCNAKDMNWLGGTPEQVSLVPFGATAVHGLQAESVKALRLETLHSTYTPAGNLLEKQTWDGQSNPVQSVQRIYDATGHWIGEWILDGQGVVEKRRERQVNASGLLLEEKVTGPDGEIDSQVQYEYDDQGRVVYEKRIAQGARIDEILHYEYEENGRRVKIQHYDLKQNPTFARHLERDEAGNLLVEQYYSQEGGRSGRLINRYDEEGRLIEQYFVKGGQTEYQRRIAYNEAGWPMEIMRKNRRGLMDWHHYIYQLDAYGNWTKRVALDRREQNGQLVFLPDKIDAREITYASPETSQPATPGKDKKLLDRPDAPTMLAEDLSDSAFAETNPWTIFDSESMKETKMERTGVITFKGNSMTLVGPELSEGSPAPDFSAVDSALQSVSLSDFKGQVVIISSVPSVDTPVCETQTKRFNEEAGKLNAKVLTVSMDLPFAHKRFCSANDVNNAIPLSDYKDHDFGEKYGVMIKELGLLTRAVFVVDGEGKLVYKEIVGEVTEHPDYDKALEAAKSAGA